MTNDKARIRLAIARGWIPAEDKSNLPEWRGMWFSPNGSGPMPCPDPFTNPADTEALIRWLKDRPVYFSIHHRPGDSVVEIMAIADNHVMRDVFHWKGNDWKVGVCELVLKVLDNE